MTFSGLSINLVLVEKKIATRTFRLFYMHTTQTLRHAFCGEQAYSSSRDSQHRTKEVKHWNYRTQATNLNQAW